ncbi:Nif11-like leader peptide family natural product precursor [Synechococcus sp. UW105]|uniref:Nif11-like leader peptide family natural product precursor n=1 Tax=Synechococcus sp. UW105 TaxID=337067 RepID=UPI000E0E23CE|nr:Nif11-like leader peptide family natural product precursor [Synechococcus sp. UW105]
MSEEQLKVFLEAVKADAGLQEKLKAATDADAVVEIAKEAGFSITAEDIQSMQLESVNDEELEGVAGGWPGGNTNQKTCNNWTCKPGNC